MKKNLISLILFSLLLAGCTYTGTSSPLNNTGGSVGNTPPTAEGNPIEKPSGNKLDLSGQQLTKVPEDVFRQTNLEELDLSNNQLTGALPGEIRFLQNLKILKASDNLMTGVPAEIGQLKNLKILNLANNQLTGLPYELGNLKNLVTFDLSGNKYSEYDLNIIKQSLPATTNIVK